MNVSLVSRVLMLVLLSAYCVSQHLWPECHRTERFHTQHVAISQCVLCILQCMCTLNDTQAVLQLAVLLAGACEKSKRLAHFLMTSRLRHMIARVLHLNRDS